MEDSNTIEKIVAHKHSLIILTKLNNMKYSIQLVCMD